MGFEKVECEKIGQDERRNILDSSEYFNYKSLMSMEPDPEADTNGSYTSHCLVLLFLFLIVIFSHMPFHYYPSISPINAKNNGTNTD